MAGHVFISYRRIDRPYVERLAAHLMAAGVAVWFDHDIDAGDRWLKVIKTKIDTCAAFIIVMTPDAEESDMVANEIDLARSLNKPIVPLLLTGEVFFGLRHTQYEDVTDGAMPSPRLVERLRALFPPDDVQAAWAEFIKSHALYQLVAATVVRLTPDGAHLRIADGIECFVTLAELTDGWAEHPEEAARVDAEVIVKILDIDPERRQISLSLRQANEGFFEGEEFFDPILYGMWATYDVEGNYVYPEGFDPERGEWLPGFEEHRKAWESRYAEARRRWEVHTRQVKNARAMAAEALTARAKRDEQRPGTPTTDAALRQRLSGGPS